MSQCIRCKHSFSSAMLSPGGRCRKCLEYARRWQVAKYAANEAYREYKKLHKRRRYRKDHPGSRHYTKHVDVNQT